MAAEILLIGLGETGASIGLALAKSGGGFHRTGYDPNAEAARSAQKAGAVDRLTSHPRHEAGRADLIVHSLGAAGPGPGLEAIAADIRGDALLIDTTPLKNTLVDRIPRRLKPGAAFVGAVPILGPKQVFRTGPLEASADLFAGGLLALVLPPGTPPPAVDVCTDLAALLGATPFFLEAPELDAATAASETLPILLSAAYVRSLTASPGWRDHGRMAGRTFDDLTRLAIGRPAAEIGEEAVSNRANIVRWLDSLLAELEYFRGAVAAADPQDLGRRLEEAASAYQTWRAQRERGPAEALPSAPETPQGGPFARLLGLGRPRASGR